MAGPEQQVGADVDVARLVLLRDIGRAFNSSLDLDRVFQLVLEKITQVLAAEAASLWLVHDTSKELVCETAIGPVSDKVKGIRLPWGTGIVGWVSQHAKPVIVADAQQDKFLSKSVDSDTGFVTRSMICAPMVCRGKCLGAIQIVNKVRVEDRFSKNDLELLVDMAIDAAIAVENARLYQAESKVKELQALLRISREIASTLDLDRILKTVVNILSSVVTYERGSMSLREENGVVLNAISGEAQLDRKDPATRALEDFLREIAQQPDALYLVKAEEGALAEDRFAKQAMPAPGPNQFMQDIGARSVLVLPLRDEEGLVGVLCLESKTPDAFSESQVEIVSILAAQATVAIRNAQLYRQVPTLNLQGFAAMLSPRAMNRRRMGVLAGIAAAIASTFVIEVPVTLAGPATVLPADQFKVVARAGGTIERVLADEGARVHAGQLLAELDDSDLKLQLDTVRTAMEISQVKIRQLRLASDAGAVAIEEIKVAQSEAEAAALRDKIAASRLTAPIAGLVMTPRVREKVGVQLNKGEVLLELARIDEMTLDIALPEGDLGEVAPDQPVSVRLLAFPTRLFPGRVEVVSPKAAAGTAGASFTVRARVANPGEELKAGMQGTARIETSPRQLVAAWFRGPAAWAQMTWWRLKP